MGLRKMGQNVTVVERGDLSVDDKKQFDCLFDNNEVGVEQAPQTRDPPTVF